MSMTGIFISLDPQHVPPLQTVVERLHRSFSTSAPLGRWTLDHRVLRSIPTTTEEKTRPQFIHLLALSFLRPGSTFVGVSPSSPRGAGRSGEKLLDQEMKESVTAEGTAAAANGEEGVVKESVVAIPTQQIEPYYGMLVSKLGALWTPRPGLQVQNGVAYDLGDFVIRIGELRQPGSGQTGTRGIVTCVETVGGRDPEDRVGEEDEGAEAGINDSRNGEEKPVEIDGNEEDNQSSRNIIRELWWKLGVEGARETWGSARSCKDWDKTVLNVRLWCEALRYRG